MRYDESGKIIKKFILNNEPYSRSQILIAGKILAVARLESTHMGIIRFWNSLYNKSKLC